MLLFLDESGTDHRASPYEVTGGIAIAESDLWPFIPVSYTHLDVYKRQGLLIVVGVVRDTFSIIESDLKSHGYDDRLIS